MKSITYNEATSLFTCECGAQLNFDDLYAHLAEPVAGEAVPAGYSADRLNGAIAGMARKLRDADPFHSPVTLGFFHPGIFKK